ncbi:MAG: M48 family metallopeptidase [Patescibacteria group bacterium]
MVYSQIDSNKRKSFALIIVFIAIILLLGWLFGKLTNYGYNGLIIAMVISIGMSLIGYYSGDKIALVTAGAQKIEKKDNPYVYRMVENLCITAGLPTPQVYLINDNAINAFAAGRDPKHASIAITAGAVEKLKNEELEGVIAHELSHIKNFDIRLMTLVAILVGTAIILSDWFFRGLFFGGRRNRDNKEGGIDGILMIVGLILMILAPIIAQLIQLALSRKREFLSDASGVLLTRYPAGLANALEKINTENQPLQRASNATAHLYISNPFGGKKNFMIKLFSTHPPIEERIVALRKMM